MATSKSPLDEHDPHKPEIVSKQDVQAQSSRTGTRARQSELLDLIDDLLSGPRWARLIVGITVVLGALIVAIINIKDAIEKESSGQIHAPYDVAALHLTDKDQTTSTQAMDDEASYLEHLDYHTRKNDEAGKGSYKSPDGGEVKLKFYSSDGCLWVYRSKGAQYKRYFVKNDLAPSSNAHKNDYIPSFAESELGTASLVPNQFERGLIGQISSHIRLAQSSEANCLNPHPGEFKWWWGQKEGCLVPMNREWKDGCHHVQIFNSCSGVWDAKIQWLRCVTPHSK